MVHILGDRALVLAQVSDLLGVHVKGQSIVLEGELRPVDLLVRLRVTHEVLEPIEISTVGRAEVLHDTLGSERLIQHVSYEGRQEHAAEEEAGANMLISTDAQSSVRRIASLLQLLHALGRRETEASSRVNFFHLN